MMDLFPGYARLSHRHYPKPFQANYWLWNRIVQALEMAGCNTDEVSFCNDGDYVHAATAQAWAIGLRRLVESTDPKTELAFDGAEQLLTRETSVTLGSIAGFLLKFADFCEQSHGFRQY